MNKENINSHCGQQIIRLRKAAKFTQEELAGALHLTRTSVCNIEAGRQSLTVENLIMICAVLKCQPADILPVIPEVNLKKLIRQIILKPTEYKTMDAEYLWTPHQIIK